MGIAQLERVPLDEVDEDEVDEDDELLDDDELLPLLLVEDDEVDDVDVDVDVEVDVLEGPDPPSPPPLPPVPMLLPSAHAAMAPAVRSTSGGNHVELDNHPLPCTYAMMMTLRFEAISARSIAQRGALVTAQMVARAGM